MCLFLEIAKSLTASHTTDSNSPTFTNLLNGQVNLRDAIRRQIDFETGGKSYKLTQNPAVLIVRYVTLVLPTGPGSHIAFLDPVDGTLTNHE